MGPNLKKVKLIFDFRKWRSNFDFLKKCRNGSVTLHIIIIKNAGLRSIRVKYKEENSL